MDDRIRFEEQGHRYYWKRSDGTWARVPRSVSTLLNRVFPVFDAQSVISRCFESWRRSGKYADIMMQHSDRAEAEAAIQAEWGRNRDKGTRLHAALEVHINVNGLHGEWAPCGEAYEGFEPEIRQFSTWASEHPYTAIRTELSVVWTRDDTAVCAGQIDFLGQTADGEYVMIDWKRVSHPLGPDERVFGTALEPYCDIPNSSYHKYSMQQSLYAEMLMQSHGYDVGDNLYLLRLHPSCDNAQFVRCVNYRDVARELLTAFS